MSNYTGYALDGPYPISSVAVSSTGGGAADDLYDGLTTGEWHSGTSGTLHWLIVTLPRPMWVAGVRLYLSSTSINNWNSGNVYVGTQNRAYNDPLWGAAVFTGDLSPDGADQWNAVSFTETWGRYILITATVTAGQAIYAKEVDAYILSLVSAMSELSTDATLLASGTRFYIDIGDGSGNVYGPGPIISAHYWKSTRRVDRVGDFEFAMPAADDKAVWVVARRYARCYAITDDGVLLVGSGIIDSIAQQMDDDGNINLVVAGSDVLRELAWRSVEFTQLRSGSSPVPHTVALAALSVYLPTGWSVVPAGDPGNNDLYYLFAGETLLAAYFMVADLSRVHCWMATERELRFEDSWSDSGLRAIEAPTAANLAAANVCLIDSIEVTAETYDLISRILPYGAEIPGLAGSYVSLFNTTKSAPTGYTLSTASKYLKRDSAEVTYGQVEAWTKYNDIKAASSAAADIESAANQLFDLVLYDLQRRSQPNTLYRLSLAHAPGIVTPMQTIRCIFRRVIGGRTVVDIDDTLYIMAATTRIDADGWRTTDLEVTNIDRWPESEVDVARKNARDNLRIG